VRSAVAIAALTPSTAPSGDSNPRSAKASLRAGSADGLKQSGGLLAGGGRLLAARRLAMHRRRSQNPGKGVSVERAGPRRHEGGLHPSRRRHFRVAADSGEVGNRKARRFAGGWFGGQRRAADPGECAKPAYIRRRHCARLSGARLARCHSILDPPRRGSCRKGAQVDAGHFDIAGQQLGLDLLLGAGLVAWRVPRSPRQSRGVVHITKPDQLGHPKRDELVAIVVALRRIGDADQEIACQPVLRRGFDAIGQALHQLAHGAGGCVLPGPAIEVGIAPRQGADPRMVPIAGRRPLAAGRQDEGKGQSDAAESRGCV